jgi:hypothetical protein
MVFAILTLKPVATVFSSLASKLMTTVFSRFASKLVATVSPGLTLKPVVGFLVEPQNQYGEGFPGFGLEADSFGLVIWVSKSLRRFLSLGLKTKWISFCQLQHKTDGGRSAQSKVLGRVSFSSLFAECAAQTWNSVFTCLAFFFRAHLVQGSCSCFSILIGVLLFAGKILSCSDIFLLSD